MSQNAKIVDINENITFIHFVELYISLERARRKPLSEKVPEVSHGRSNGGLI